MKTDFFVLQSLAPGAFRPRRLVATGLEWTVDLTHATVVHESGLALSFVSLSQTEPASTATQGMTFLDLCWAPTGFPVWAIAADAAAIQDTLQAFAITDDAGARRLLSSLTHQAGQSWLAALSCGELPPERNAFR